MTKTTKSPEAEQTSAPVAIGVVENQGGAPCNGATDHHYGRRVEADRSWTVYHVFTGIPAHGRSGAMSGMSRSDATSRMLSLNLCNAERQGPRSISGKVPERSACEP